VPPFLSLSSCQVRCAYEPLIVSRLTYNRKEMLTIETLEHMYSATPVSVGLVGLNQGL